MAALHARHLEAPPPNVGADRTRGVTVLPRTTRGSNMMFIGGIDRSVAATHQLISFRVLPQACGRLRWYTARVSPLTNGGVMMTLIL